jgi:hypothetical protein
LQRTLLRGHWKPPFAALHTLQSPQPQMRVRGKRTKCKALWSVRESPVIGGGDDAQERILARDAATVADGEEHAEELLTVEHGP